MDILKSIKENITNFFYLNEKDEFKKPEGYKNINTSQSIKNKNS